MILKVILIVRHQDCIVIESQSQLVFIKIILLQATKERKDSRRTISSGRHTSVLPRCRRWAARHSVRLPVCQDFFFFLSLFFNDRKVHLLPCNVLNMPRTHSGGRKGPGSTAYGSHQSMPRSSEIPNPDQVALGACLRHPGSGGSISAPPFYRALDHLITTKSSGLLLSFSREVA